MRKTIEKILWILILVAGMLLTLIGCSEKKDPESMDPAPPSSMEESSGAQQNSSGEGLDSVPSQPQGSQDPQDSSNGGGNGIVDNIETGNQAFDEKFAQNPIDAAYEEANQSAFSTRDMVEITIRFSDIWKAEMEAAYQKLLEKSGDGKSKIELEQAEWQQSFEAERAKLEEEAAGGGTMAQVKQYNGLRMLYRARANALYGSLYAYDPNFSFSYTGEAVG